MNKTFYLYKDNLCWKFVTHKDRVNMVASLLSENKRTIANHTTDYGLARQHYKSLLKEGFSIP